MTGTKNLPTKKAQIFFLTFLCVFAEKRIGEFFCFAFLDSNHLYSDSLSPSPSLQPSSSRPSSSRASSGRLSRCTGWLSTSPMPCRWRCPSTHCGTFSLADPICATGRFYLASASQPATLSPCSSSRWPSSSARPPHDTPTSPKSQTKRPFYVSWLKCRQWPGWQGSSSLLKWTSGAPSSINKKTSESNAKESVKNNKYPNCSNDGVQVFIYF